MLCDRFIDSTLAYQGYGRGLDVGSLQRICAIAAGGLEPSFVLLLDVPVGVTRARLKERAAVSDRIEAEDDGFHERVRQGFLELAKSARHRVLDGTLPPERLIELSLQEIRPHLGAGVT